MEYDKKLHMVAGGAVALVVALAFGYIAGVAASAVAGVLKEWYDSFHPDKHTVDPYDALATMAGGVLGAAVAVVILNALV